ncbi:MAG TPA: iron-containing alcohol dehydrogenase [Candidatus Binatia bacterium]|nr:iron-containing alcohol dehydrogenase [Candidatus Binatia bacterium]
MTARVRGAVQSTQTFEQPFPGWLVFGRGTLSRVGSLAARFGRGALVVTDPGLVRAGIVDTVVASLRTAGLATHVFDAVAPNPSVEQVEAGLAAGAGRGIEVIVSVGGGSAHDCAKAIALVAANGGQVGDYVGVDRSSSAAIPVVAVNTTAGSGADVSRYAVITDPERSRKMIIADWRCTPVVAINDPLTTLGLPKEQTAATGLDALTHAIEAYVSTAASALTDLFALRAIELIVHALPRVLRDGTDVVAREQMLLAATFAGLAINGALVGAVHALAHALGALTDLPHGTCNGLLLPAVVEYNLPAARSRYRDVARAFGLGPSPERLPDALRAFGRSVGLPTGLGPAGVDRAIVPDLVERALDDLCLTTNPRPVGRDDAIRIYERSW